MICTPGELDAMDFGFHMQVIEEWNEEADFGWQDAMVVLQGYYTRVIQTDKAQTVYVVTYVSGGKGDLVSLRVYNNTSGIVKPEIHRQETINAAYRDFKIGTEMWWHEGHGYDL